jgi:excisionase family DNA binding protein
MDLYRVGEFAAILQVNPRTVRRWLANGLVACIRLPSGERRIPRPELDSILGQATREELSKSRGPRGCE